MKSIREYFETDFTNKKAERLIQEKCTKKDSDAFYRFTSSHFVIENINELAIPSFKEKCTQHEVIELSILFLLRKNMLNNVVTFGYRIARGNDVNQKLFCKSSNSNVNELKNEKWGLLHNLIGTKKFIHLLINCTVISIQDNGIRQIVGNRGNRPNTPPIWQLSKCLHPKQKRVITTKPILNKESNTFGHFVPLKRSIKIKTLGNIMFKHHYANMPFKMKNRVDTTLLGLLKLCHKKHNYMSMLNQVCPRSRNSSHLSLQTPKGQVIKFTILLLEKLIPMEMFGSKKNKSKLFSKISKLLTSPLNTVFPLEEFISGIRIKSIRYLIGFQPDSNPDTLHISTNLYTEFTYWLLTKCVPHIISSFFYCTDISSTVSLAFFRHDEWKSITAPFLSRYFEDFLVENLTCRNHESYLLSTFNHSRMRVVPKKAVGEFRVIAVPCKGVDDEERISYEINQKTVVKPTQSILMYLRNKQKTHFEKIGATFQIPRTLSRFKQRLLMKYGKIPVLHFMKFDIASCYDSIPRKKVLDVLGILMRNEVCFYVRSFAYVNSEKKIMKIVNTVNGYQSPQNADIAVDNVRTYYFTPSDITNIIEAELFKTSLRFGDKCYLRRDGLFQGSNFSALLVDLVYDNLLESYDEFRCSVNEENLILRIADDFLVISTDGNQIKNIRNLALDGFADYNAIVKKEKIVVTNSQNSPREVLQFCALHIDINKLEVWKHSEVLNIPSIHSGNTSRIYERLIFLLEMRLSYKTLDGNLNSTATILLQIDHIVSNIVEIFDLSFRHKEINTKNFEYFIDNIILSIVSYAKENKIEAKVFVTLAKLLVVQNFLKVFRKSRSRYVALTKILENIEEESLSLLFG